MSNMAMEMEMESPRNKDAGRPGVEEVGYEYKKVDWKGILLNPKNIRKVPG